MTLGCTAADMNHDFGGGTAPLPCVSVPEAQGQTTNSSVPYQGLNLSNHLIVRCV